ncbi:MAG TPA: cytochrome b [Vicinamibacterales bacterium]|nr:cytochrome b [Vicinamibacterales bacterium]
MQPVTPQPAGVVDLSDPKEQYSRGAKWFHWLTVPPIAISLLSGLTIRFMNDDVKMSFYTLHESLGILMLLLTTARLLWRSQHPAPPLPAHIPAMVRLGANAVHASLYVALIVQPVLGFFTTNALGFPQQGATAFLGFINLPKFMDASPDVARTLHWAHSIVGWTLVPLIAAHVAGVVYHHAIRRDGTLLRMI